MDSIYAVLVSKSTFISLSTWRSVDSAMNQLSDSAHYADLETMALVTYPSLTPLLFWDATGRPALFPMDC
jgi:hypothetical protein